MVLELLGSLTVLLLLGVNRGYVGGRVAVGGVSVASLLAMANEILEILYRTHDDSVLLCFGVKEVLLNGFSEAQEAAGDAMQGYKLRKVQKYGGVR